MKNVMMWMLTMLLWTGSTAAAQDYGMEQARADLSFAWALPQGELGDNVDEAGMGLAFFIGGRVPNLPFVLGTEVGFLTYGTDESLSLHSLLVDRDGLSTDLPLEVVNVETGHNILLGHLVGRLQLPFGPVQPYVDGLAGLKYFLTQTRVRSDIIIDDGFHAVADFGDLALSYGVGGGLDFSFFNGPMGWDERPLTISLNVGVRYLFGTEAEYLTRGSVQQQGGAFVFELTESRTDLLMPQFGFRVKM